MQAVGGRAKGAGSYSRDDRHKRFETAIPVRVAICEAVVLKEMIEFGAPGGRVERDEGSRREDQASVAKFAGWWSLSLLGSARIWGPTSFQCSGLGASKHTGTKVLEIVCFMS